MSISRLKGRRRFKVNKADTKGFTLIELLVVIAIIALLLSIIIPSLNKAREVASGIICLGNQKSLSLALIMYCSDNNDKMIGGHATYTPNNGYPPWVMPPLDYNSSGQIMPVNDYYSMTLEYRLNGIREGALYDLVNNTDVYHCPGDRRYRRGTNHGTEPGYHIYRSYSMPQSLATNDNPDVLRNELGYEPVTKLSLIKSPSGKYVFVEEAYDGWFMLFNDESWTFRPYYSDGTFRYELWDPLGQFHNVSCTFGFADGHSEKHKWRDKRTIDFFFYREATGSNIVIYDGNVDIEYLARSFPYIPPG